MARKIEHDARPKAHLVPDDEQEPDPNLHRDGIRHEDSQFAAEHEEGARHTGALSRPDPAPDTKPRPREGKGGQHVNLGRDEPFSSAARVEVDAEDERREG